MLVKSLGRALALLSLAAGVVAISQNAHAVLVNGTFTSVLPADAIPVFANQTITGTFQYDTSIPAQAGATSNAAGFGAITDFSFNIAGFFPSSGYTNNANPFSGIQMYNDLPSPNFDHISFVPQATELSVPTLAVFPFAFAVLRMDDPTSSIFSDAQVLPTSLSLADFSGGGVFDLFFSTNTHNFDEPPTFLEIDSTLTSLSTSIAEQPTVPEPASLSLIGMGIAGLAAWRAAAAH